MEKLMSRMDDTMYKDYISAMREMSRLREKLRKAEARAEQAEHERDIARGENAAIEFAMWCLLDDDAHMRAQPLIERLLKLCKTFSADHVRLVRGKAAWTKERKELLEEIERLKAEASAIAEGGVLEGEGKE